MFMVSRLIQQLSIHRQLDGWADQLAAVCLHQVAGRISPATALLRHAQARGYIRARALAVVHAELPRGAYPEHVHAELQEMALQRVVDRTLQSLAQQRTALPARRAA